MGHVGLVEVCVWTALTMTTMLAAHAATPPSPDWASLTPWRTYVIVEHVTDGAHWFVVDKVPGLGKRCEVRVPMQGGDAPLVTCGVQTIGDGGRQSLPTDAKGAHKRATQALTQHLSGIGGGSVKGQLVYLGPLRRVTFRQVVVTGAGASANDTRALSWTSSWDVDLASGRVDHGVVPARVGVTALCSAGFQVDCDAPPKLLAWAPPPRFEGMLLDPADGAVEPADLALLDTAVRGVALAKDASAWRATAPRTVGPGLLPQGFEGGAVVSLVVQAQGPGSQGGGTFQVDVPLREAAFGPVHVRMPVEGVPATVELRLDLPAEMVEVRILPQGERYVARDARARCALVVDGDRAALPEACDVDWGGAWLTWANPAGDTRVAVQVADQITTLPGPSKGPRLLPP